MNQISIFILEHLQRCAFVGSITVDQQISQTTLATAMSNIHAVDVSERDVRHSLNELANEGHPVCSTNRGIYLARTADEMQPAIDYITSFCMENLKRRRGLKMRQKLMREEPTDLFGHPLLKKEAM